MACTQLLKYRLFTHQPGSANAHLVKTPVFVGDTGQLGVSYDDPALKATVYPITDATPNRIAIVARPRPNDWLCEEISALSREGIEILVSMLTDEEAEELGLNDESAECAAAGISFVNVAVSDRSVPSDTNAFLRIIEQLAIRVKEGHYFVNLGETSGTSMISKSQEETEVS